MPGRDLSGGGFKARAGALTLLYLTSPWERDVLLRLLAQATTGVELVEEWEIPDADDPVDADAVFSDTYLLEPVDPGADRDDPDTMLQPTAAGREAPFVGAVLQQWLNAHPGGPIELGPEAGPVLWPMLSAWASSVMHAFAAGPHTARQVCEEIQVMELDAVEVRIDLLEEAGLLRALPCAEDEDEPYEATEWLRMAIAPLAAAARMELRHPPGDTAPIAALDVGAAFHFTLPLLELPEELSGSCALAVELEHGLSGSPAGVTARIEAGRVVSCKTGLDPNADAWATASAANWLDTLIEPEVKRVRSGGERQLARCLLYELHRILFGVPVG